MEFDLFVINDLCPQYTHLTQFFPNWFCFTPFRITAQESAILTRQHFAARTSSTLAGSCIKKQVNPNKCDFWMAGCGISIFKGTMLWTTAIDSPRLKSLYLLRILTLLKYVVQYLYNKYSYKWLVDKHNQRLLSDLNTKLVELHM